MKRVRVKICGITDIEQAKTIAALNVDALGFILYKKSPRYVTAEKTRSIIHALPPFVKTVGVFVNEPLENLNEIMVQTGLDLAQLSGDESPAYCQQLNEKRINWIRSFRIKDSADLEETALFQANFILLDAWSDSAFGGTGKTFEWAILDTLPPHFQVILAGGININNVEKAIKTVRPYGIDISSSVEEAPGIKSIKKVKALLKRIELLEG
jgi:phosphoribosylanthranilate isomerase